MADPTTAIAPVVQTWHWLAAAGGALVTLLGLIGVQFSESRKRGRSDEKLDAVTRRGGYLADETACLRDRCAKLELAHEKVSGRLDAIEAICEERHGHGARR